ncbi:MAG: phosphate/phosphite/phosphonate ABC transporter substrate-binding protein [Candidatus Sericytochromatia bacterium]|nr:phosphate/phosphite/phosphonate ABC transporter substrate-binding protein [Candidatus Tanganyikabacteria bacterium]
MNVRPLVGLLVFVTGILATAGPAAGYKPRKLVVGFAPWENPGEIGRIASEVSRMLGQSLGMRVEPRITSDYAGVVEAMSHQQVDMAFFPPAAFVLAERKAGAKVILKSVFRGRSAYYAAIITRQDSGIRSLKDLKGKSIAFVEPNSTSGSIYPRVMLIRAGLKAERDMRVQNAGGHDAVVLAVFHRKVDAGACFLNNPKPLEAAWTRPGVLPNAADRDQIRILGISPPIPSDNIAVRRDLDPELVGRIQEFFLNLSNSDDGSGKIRKIFRVDGFQKANSRDYDPVREAYATIGLKLER